MGDDGGAWRSKKGRQRVGAEQGGINVKERRGNAETSKGKGVRGRGKAWRGGVMVRRPKG